MPRQLELSWFCSQMVILHPEIQTAKIWELLLQSVFDKASPKSAENSSSWAFCLKVSGRCESNLRRSERPTAISITAVVGIFAYRLSRSAGSPPYLVTHTLRFVMFYGTNMVMQWLTCTVDWSEARNFPALLVLGIVLKKGRNSIPRFTSHPMQPIPPEKTLRKPSWSMSETAGVSREG